MFQVYTLLLNSPGDLFIYGDPAPAANTGTTSAAQIQLSHDCQDSSNFRLLKVLCIFIACFGGVFFSQQNESLTGVQKNPA